MKVLSSSSILLSSLSIGVLWIFTISPPNGCLVHGCQFYPLGEYLRFVRIPENLAVNSEVIQIEVHPRRNLSLEPVDKEEDVEYFKFRAVNKSIVSVRLAKSLENLVDGLNPQSVLKFRMICDYLDGDDTVSSYLSVSVYVEDINDNAPIFVHAPYSIKVDEQTATGSTIFKEILALDRDKLNTPNSDVHYTIVNGNEKGKFSLEPPASLVLMKPLDYDTGDTDFLLTIMATDRGTPQKNATTTISIAVVDNDDLGPKFTSDFYKTQIEEFYPITGNKIHLELTVTPPILAEDQDRGINATVRYDITAGNENRLFQIDSKNGSLFLNQELDADILPSDTFHLQVQATQEDNPLKYDTAKVEVKVIDINDNLPQFEVDIYNISIVENLPSGFSVLQVVATDIDRGENGEFAYHLVDPSQAFSIDGKSGWLSVRNQAKLDREQRSTLSMKVFAREKIPSVVMKGKPTSETDREPYVSVEVTLLDANDNNPSFVPHNMYEFNVSSDAAVGYVIGRVQALDPDLGPNGDVIYSIEKGTNATIATSNNGALSAVDNYFEVNSRNGNVIVGKRPLPVGRYTVFVEASDQPVNPSERRFALAILTIQVSTNDQKHLPEFVGSPYEFWVGNDVPVSTSVGQIRVEGFPNNNNDVIYDLLHGYHEGVPFAVEERSGTISVVDEMNKFDKSEYYFEGVATDPKSLTLTTNVTIHVVESESDAHSIRNNEPVTISLRVRENQAGALVGHLGKKMNNSYRYGNYNGSHDTSGGTTSSKNQRYIVVNQPDIRNKFAISADGAIYTQQALDREEQNHYLLVIFVESNKRVIRGLYHVNVTVEDENDNPPIFDRDWYEGYVKENSPAGTEIRLDRAIKVDDSDVGTNAYFSLSLKGNGSELFAVDQKSRTIQVKEGAMLDREYRDVYQMRIVATDRGNLSSEAKLTIHVEDVNDHSPRFVQMVVHHREGVQIASVGYAKNKNRFYGAKNNNNNNNSTTGSSTNFLESPNPSIVVPENLTTGTPVIKLRATDEDVGENSDITYQMFSETYIPDTSSTSSSSNSNSRRAITRYKTPHFVVHPITGEITVANTLPAETDFVLNVSAIDRGGLEGYIGVKVRIKDVNNNVPRFEQSRYDFSIVEGVYKDRILSKIRAVDDDFGENARISYSIVVDNPEEDGDNDGEEEEEQQDEVDEIIPFKISPHDGTLMAHGELDRERKEFYTIHVIAEDNAQEPETRLRSSVKVDVRISDLNDNAPNFYGYDKLIKYPIELLLGSNNVNDNNNNNNNINNNNNNNNVNHLTRSKEKEILLPTYRASVSENAGPGTSVIKVYANDSDLLANGNGMVLFHLPRIRKNRQRELFAIDSKDGLISTLTGLDYEQQSSHEIVVLASDLGNPSLTSTALVIVDVVDIRENNSDELSSPIFAHRYYEMEVEENCAIPISLLALNVSAGKRFGTLRFSLIPDEHSDYFKVNANNGSVELIRSPDRELAPMLQTKIRVDRLSSKNGKSLQMLYPVQQDTISDLAANEVKIIVHVRDVNDNPPLFIAPKQPLIAAIPNTAPYGYTVIKMQATDPDEGINADIRYNLISTTINSSDGLIGVRKRTDGIAKFAIDPVSGQIKTAANFVYDSDQTYTVDVKATDMAGAANGMSCVVSLLVFVLNDQAKVTVMAAVKPTEIEANMKNITNLLSNISGLDVRVRKIEPYYERDTQNTLTTNLHLYAIDSLTNAIVDNEVLMRTLKDKERLIKSEMEPYHFIGITSSLSSDNEIRSQRSEKTILSGLETMTVMLGCIIFLGALTAAMCVACFNRKKSKYENATNLFPTMDPADLPFSLYTGTKNMAADLSNCRPRSLFNPLSFVEESGNNTFNEAACRRLRRSSYHHHHHHHQQHHPSCLKSDNNKCAQSLIRSRSTGLLATSLASLHSSSERDSGIEAAHCRRTNAVCCSNNNNNNNNSSSKCQCKHNNVFFSSSGNSSNGSYEDSLKSLQPQQLSSGSDSDMARRHHHIMPNFSRLHKELSGNQAARIRQSLSRLNA